MTLAYLRMLEKESGSLSCQLSNSSSEPGYFSDRITELERIESCKSYKYVTGYQIEPYQETTFGQENFLFEFDIPTWLRDKLLLYKFNSRERLHTRHRWLFNVLSYDQQSTAYIRDIFRLGNLGFLGLGKPGHTFVRGWGKFVSHLYRFRQPNVISWPHISSGHTIVKASQYSLVDLSEIFRLITSGNFISLDVGSGRWQFFNGYLDKDLSLTADSFLSYKSQFDLRKEDFNLTKYLSNPTSLTYKFSTFTKSDRLWGFHHLVMSGMRISWNLSRSLLVLGWSLSYVVNFQNLTRVTQLLKMFSVWAWGFMIEPLKESLVLSQEEEVLFQSLEGLEHKKSINQHDVNLTNEVSQKKPYEMLGFYRVTGKDKVRRLGTGVTLSNLGVEQGNLWLREYGYWLGRLSAYDQFEVKGLDQPTILSNLKKSLSVDGQLITSCWHLIMFRRRDILAPTKLGKWSSFYLLRFMIPKLNDVKLAPSSFLRRWVRLIPLVELIEKASLSLDQRAWDDVKFLQSVSKGERYLNTLDNWNLMVATGYISSYLTYHLEPVGSSFNFKISHLSEKVNNAHNLIDETFSSLRIRDNLIEKETGTKFKPSTLVSDSYNLELSWFPETLRAKKGFLKEALNLGVDLNASIMYSFVSLHSSSENNEYDPVMSMLYLSIYRYLKPFHSRWQQVLNCTVTYLKDQVSDNGITNLGLLLGSHIMTLSPSSKIFSSKGLMDYLKGISWILPFHVLNFRKLQVDLTASLGEVKPKYNHKFNSFKSMGLNLVQLKVSWIPWMSKLENLDTDEKDIDEIQRFKLKVIFLSLKERSINSYQEIPEVAYSLTKEWFNNFCNLWIIQFGKEKVTWLKETKAWFGVTWLTLLGLTYSYQSSLIKLNKS